MVAASLHYSAVKKLAECRLLEICLRIAKFSGMQSNPSGHWFGGRRDEAHSRDFDASSLRNFGAEAANRDGFIRESERHVSLRSHQLCRNGLPFYKYFWLKNKLQVEKRNGKKKSRKMF